VRIDQALARKERANSRYISEQVRLAAYRIAEASLTNVVKHSGTKTVGIDLEEVTDEWFSLTVRDVGTGFDVEAVSAGMGVGIMHDYAEVLGGNYSITSSAKYGTQVRGMLPLREPAPPTTPTAETSE